MNTGRYIITATLVISMAAHGKEADESIKNALEKINPGVDVLSVTDSPVPGLKSVTLGNNEFLYVTDDAKYIFTGQLLRREGDAVANLTELERQQSRKKALSEVDLSQAITFASSQKNSHEVFVFTDVSCTYCRKFHNQINDYNDAGITVHYLAYPRDGADSVPAQAMAAAWCSDEPRKALTEALTAKKEVVNRTPPDNCNSPVKADYKLGKNIGVAGTPGIYDKAGRQLGGYLSVDDLKAHLEDRPS